MRQARVARPDHGTDEEIELLGDEPAVRNWQPCRWQVVASMCLSVLAMCAAGIFIVDPCQIPFRPLRTLFQGTPLSVEGKFEVAVRELKAVKSKAEADAIVAAAMAAAKEKSEAQHKLAVLPPDVRVLQTPIAVAAQGAQKNYLPFEREELARGSVALAANRPIRIRDQDLRSQEDYRTAFCVFNIVETMDSLTAFALDIEAITRTCPPPRDEVGTFACTVNSETMAQMLGNAATWLSNAVSTCGILPNAGAECGAAATGTITAIAQIHASTSLAMTTCKQEPLEGLRQKHKACFDNDCTIYEGAVMSQVGRQPKTGRRLFMGSGFAGMGVQCSVDVGFIITNLYKYIFFIQRAAHLNFCDKNVRYGPYDYLTGVPEAACAMDATGAIAWITQIATFSQQLVSHCPDFMNLPTLCGSSITGMVSSVFQLASWGAGLHISCAKGESLTEVAIVLVLSNYTVIEGNVRNFLVQCSAYMHLNFGASCQLATRDPDDNVELDLLGTRKGLRLAEASVREDGLTLDGFSTLDFVARKPFPLYDRRLSENEEESEEANAEELQDKGDPVKHPNMRDLRSAVRKLAELRNTFATGQAAQNLTLANLKEKLHLMEPVLKSGQESPTCQ